MCVVFDEVEHVLIYYKRSISTQSVEIRSTFIDLISFFAFNVGECCGCVREWLRVSLTLELEVTRRRNDERVSECLSSAKQGARVRFADPIIEHVTDTIEF